MKMLRHNLFRQLISIGIIIFGIVFISLGLLLPKVLVPIYEKNIYNYLKQPLGFINQEIGSNEILSDVAYIFIAPNNKIIISDNFNKIIDIKPQQILSEINLEYGKFKYGKNIYYYYTSGDDYISKIAITDSKYINQMRTDVILAIFPILIITLFLILILILFWTRRLLLKIYYLKEKVANIDKDNYLEMYNYDYKVDDELNSLSDAIDDMHFTLKAGEEYKNQMYQNISHDFKTPLTVIKSYIEAIEDGIQDKEEGTKIIKEQISKLENKVHSLLYLNKLNYLKEHKSYKEEKVDVSLVLQSSIEKFKYQRPDIKWEVKISNSAIFNGTFDMWEAIIDNMLNNFMRYTESKIRIILKNQYIVFYNDGPNIDESLLYDIFTPYKKGIEGKFGLGLSIIKKTILLMGYEINVKNEKKGVTFTIR